MPTTSGVAENGTGFLLEVMKMWNSIEVVVAQVCEYTKPVNCTL